MRSHHKRWPLIVFFASLLLLLALLLRLYGRQPAVEEQVAEMPRNGLDENSTDLQRNSRENLGGAAIEAGAATKASSVGVGTVRWNVEDLRIKATSANVLVRNKVLDDFKKQLMLLQETDPELHALRALLREIPPEDDAFAPLVAAAGAVGTPQIQRVLTQRVEDGSNDWRTFSAIVPVLGGLVAPSRETLDLLSRMAREGDADFSQTAALALGASVRGMAEVQPERARQILELYIAKLQDAQADAEDVKESLSVLGNSGLAAAAQPILSLTRHSRADVRAEAVMALRFIRTPEVEQRLIEVFSRDTETQVRLSAVESLLHAPLHDDVLPAAQRIVGDVLREPRFLRERAVDLIMHLELPASAKRDLRTWLLKMADREQDKKMKGKLVSAAHQLMP